MEGLGWEERYHRVKDEHTSLMQRCNEQEDTIRRMNTKLAQIEKSLRIKQRLDSEGAAPPKPQPRDRETEDLVEELQRRNAELQRENADLKVKNKNLSVALAREKQKKAAARLRAQGGAGVGPAPASTVTTTRPGHVSLAKKGGDNPEIAPGDEEATGGARKLAQLVDQLRARVVAAEDQLNRVREENQRLRSDWVRAGLPPRDEADAALLVASAAGRVRLNGGGDENEALARELRDARARVQLLQTRHDHIEAKSKAQADLHEGTVQRLEECNRQLRDLRRTVQDLQHAKDVAEAKASRANDLEETVLELRQANRSLEEQVTRLCESPFVATAFAGQAHADRLAEMERSERASRSKIDHLQETAQTHHSALLALQKQAARLREEKEAAERALQELRGRYSESEAGQRLLADKMRLYGGDDDVNMEELERALTMVRRKLDGGAATLPPFLENAEGPDADDPATLKRRLQHAQVQCLSLARELERAERMLKAQMAINRDLHLELEDSTRRSTAATAELRQRLSDFEALALERLTRVHRLEAQVKQLVYAASGGGKGAAKNGSAAGDDGAVSDALLAELAEGDFGPDENVVEVWVVAVDLEGSALAAAASTFVMVDFYDYESQATPLLTGNNPRFDFAATYKVTVDDFFLRFLGTETLSLELSQARAADFELLARARVPLDGLLRSAPRIVLPREPLLSVKDATVVGYLHVEVRMALPVVELYALFLERNPAERRRAEHARLVDAEAAGIVPRDTAAISAAEAARLHNELEVIVVACEGLPPREDNRGHARPYVHYQLLGFQDAFTPVAAPATSAGAASRPEFHHAAAYPVTTDPKLLRFLSRYALTLTVLDDVDANGGSSGGPESKDDGSASGAGWGGDGLIGEAKVLLAPLADGDAVDSWVDIEDEAGRRCGRIRVGVRFKQPLKTARDLGPNALSGVEVEQLISRFSPQRDGQVAYVPFLRYADPPPAVIAALARLHAFMGARAAEGKDKSDKLGEMAGTGGLLAAVAVGAGCAGAEALTEDEFISGMMRAAPASGVPPDELSAVFAYADVNGEGRVPLAELAAMAARPPAAARRLAEKLRKRCRELNLRGHFPSAPFEDADPARLGRVTRLQFKHALRQMGFVLVDEPDAPDGWDPSGFTGGPGGYGTFHASAGPEDGLLVEETLPLRRQAADEALKQREAFEKHVREVEALARGRVEAAAAAAGASSSKKVDAAVGPEDSVEPTAVAESERFPRVQHASAAVVCDSGARAPAARTHDAAATRVQAAYRGHRGRRGVHERRTAGAKAAAATAEALAAVHNGAGDASGGEAALLAAEDALAVCVDRVEGARALPDLRAAFAAVDRGGTGFVDKTRFALAMRRHPDLRLPPAGLAAAMAAFDASPDADGSLIDYRAFISFAESCGSAPERSGAVERMREMAIRGGGADAFAKRDRGGAGVLKRADFLDALRELGLAGARTPARQLHLTALLFEVAEDRVDYGAFVQFVAEQRGAAAAAALERRLRRHVLAVRDSKGLDLRAAFAAFDKRGSGVIEQADFSRALHELGFRCSQEELATLYKTVDPRGAGVVYRDFVDFVETGTAAGGMIGVAAPPLNNAALDGTGALRLRRRAHAAVLDAAQRLSGDSGPLERCFRRYDWRRTGVIGPAAFARAALAAGFAFTRSETLELAAHFADGEGGVQYSRFLAWATPDDAAAAAALVVPVGTSVLRSGGGEAGEEAVVKLRTAAARSALDVDKLRAAFERRDRGGSGVVATADMTDIFHSLGLAVTATDVRGLAARYGGGGGEAFYYADLVADLGTAVRKGGKAGGTAADRLALFEKVRAELGRVVRRTNSRRPVRRVFEAIGGGAGEDGRISAADLQSGMAEVGVKLSEEDARAVVREMRGGGSGDRGTTYEQFLEFLEGQPGQQDLGVESPRVNSGSPTRQGAGKGKAVKAGSTGAPQRLREAIEDAIARGVDYRAAFERRDPDSEGCISAEDFDATLQDIGAALSARDVDELVSAYSGEKGVRYLEALRVAVVKRHCEGEGDGDGESWKTEERLRQMVRRRFDWRAPGKLRKAFKHFAAAGGGGSSGKDSSHAMEPSFCDGLSRLGFNLSAAQERTLFRRLDADRSDRISYPEFVLFVRDANHADVAHRLLQALKRAGAAADDVSETMTRASQGEGGGSDSEPVLTLAAFEAALRRLGVKMARRELERVALRFDPNEEGVIHVDRFCRFVAGEPEGGPAAGAGYSRGRGGGSGGRRLEEVDGSDSEAAAAPPARRASPARSGSGGRTHHKSEHERSPPRRGRREGAAAAENDGAITLSRSTQRRVLEAVARAPSGGSAALARALEKCDLDASGELPAADFGAALDRVGVVMSSRDVAEIAECFPGRRRSGVRYQRFLRWLEEQEALTGDSDELGSQRGRGSGSRDRERGEGDGRRHGSSRNGSARSGRRRREERPLSKSRVSFAEDTGSEGGTGAASLIRHLKGALRKEIRRAAAADGAPPNLRRAFKEIDTNKSGTVSQSEFRRALDVMGLRLPDADVTALMEVLDTDGNGQISYEEFRVFAADGSEEGGEGSARGRTASRARERGGESSARKDDLQAVLRKEIRRIAAVEGAPPNLRRAFKEIDADRNGTVSRKEFVRALKKMGFKLSEDDVTALMDALDVDNDGRVNYEELRSFAADNGDPNDRSAGGGGSSSSSARKELQSVLRAEIRRVAAVDGAPPNFRRTFREVDADGNGTISRKEFVRALKSMGFKLAEDDVTALMDVLDTDGDGRVNYEELRAFAADGGEVEKDRASSSKHGSGGRSSSAARKDLQAVLRKEIRRVAAVDGAPPNFKRTFRELDANGDGTLSRKEFVRGLKALGLKLSENDSTALMDALDVDNDGRVNYEELRAFAADDGEAETSTRSSSERRRGSRDRNSGGSKDSATKFELKKVLGKEIRRVAAVEGAPPNFKRTFQEIDVDRSGTVSRREFQRALKAMGLKMSEEDVTALLDALDKDGDGRIDYDEFRAFAADAEAAEESTGRKDRHSDRDSTNRKDDGGGRRVHKALQAIVRKEIRRVAAVEGAPPNLKRAFQEFDADGSGTVNHKEFQRALKAMGLKLSENDTMALMEALDVDNNGRISFEEFRRFAASDTDGEAGGRGDGSRRGSSADKKGPSSSSRALADLAAELRTARASLKELQRCLDRAVSAGGSGAVDADALRDALERMGVRLGRHAAEEAIEAAGGRGGRINVDDFLAAMEDAQQGGSRR